MLGFNYFVSHKMLLFGNAVVPASWILVYTAIAAIGISLYVAVLYLTFTRPAVAQLKLAKANALKARDEVRKQIGELKVLLEYTSSQIEARNAMLTEESYRNELARSFEGVNWLYSTAVEVFEKSSHDEQLNPDNDLAKDQLQFLEITYQLVLLILDAVRCGYKEMDKLCERAWILAGNHGLSLTDLQQRLQRLNDLHSSPSQHDWGVSGQDIRRQIWDQLRQAEDYANKNYFEMAWLELQGSAELLDKYERHLRQLEIPKSDEQ